MTRIKLFVTLFSIGLLFYACEAESLDEALNNENASDLTISKAASLQAEELENDQLEITSKSGDDDDKPGMDDEAASSASGDDDDKPGMDDDDDDGRFSGDDDDKPGMDDGFSGDDDDKPGMDDGFGASQKSGDDDDKPGMDDN